ncbi:Helicase C-terminal [Penicillium samsonianum]|uniref:Helicase C-terminal n=1 Tax=Penicillium samsonianum TaxID=1882272 RepID=UPI0025465D43|nr:Helicase C-terminal [Penicillium samsonianum]KAJ6137705.1 Helicase C-terminal [Penicillium samsonianum]
MTYDVGSVGLNLYEACDRVILSAPGKSGNHEAQAEGRCLRVYNPFPEFFIPKDEEDWNDLVARKAGLRNKTILTIPADWLASASEATPNM